MTGAAAVARIDIEKPRYDQSTYEGRAKHFFVTTNPLNCLKSEQELAHAKEIVTKYRAGEAIPNLTEDELWHAKHIYDSAFHPETGEKMFILGRMSFQVPGNMLITGCMLQFYKTTPAVVFWQWINQTFNAIVNYTNRSGESGISLERLGGVYVLASTGAVATALSVNRLAKSAPPLIGRFVPFVAVAAANCINIPFMRSQEIMDGIPVFTEGGEPIGQSPTAAKKAIAQVVFSRICMAMPGMLLPPILMNTLERRGVLARRPWIGAPLQVALCGVLLTFATPMCCALFPQKSSITFQQMEPALQETCKKRGIQPERVYFNKGL